MLIPALLLALVPPSLQDPDPTTLRLDAVELVDRGAEVSGLAEFEARRYGFTYRFQSAANRERFLALPERYEIQCGGACARMGPLSGIGTTEIHALHAGRLYIFASEACREGFLKTPERLLELDEPTPQADGAARAAGAALLARALEGIGGAEALDALAAVRFVREDRAPDGGLEYRQTRVLRFPDGVFKESLYTGHPPYRTLACAAGAWEIAEDAQPLHPVRRRAFERDMRLHPLPLLRARTRPDFLALCAGEAELDGRALDLLRIHLDGRSVVLGLDREDGRVRTLEHRGRGPSAALGQVRIVYAVYEPVGTLHLPRQERRWFEGSEGATTTWRVEVEPDLDPALFRAPR